MAMLINGERVPDELVEEESARLNRCQSALPNSASRPEAQLRLMAACAVVDRILIRQHADRDPRSIDPAILDAEVRKAMRHNNCRSSVNEPAMRRAAEQELRLKRAMDELAGDFARPTPDEVMVLFDSWKGRIASVEKASAVHIIVHINQGRSEAEARTIIERTEAELKRRRQLRQGRRTLLGLQRQWRRLGRIRARQNGGGIRPRRICLEAGRA